MDIRPLSVLICGSNETALQQMACSLTDEGVKVQTSKHLIDYIYSFSQEWDFLLIDLDGLNDFLCSLLPAILNTFPHLPRIGISSNSVTNMNSKRWGYNFELDAYLSEVPRPEELLVLFPQVLDKYLCDEDTLHDLVASSLHFFPASLKSMNVKVN